MAIKILIADRLEVVRYGLRTLIEGQADWDVCGEAASGDALLELAAAGKPDVVVLDSCLPGLGGVAVVGRLREAMPELEILVFSAHDDPEALAASLESGARGYVLKDEGLHEVVAAVRALARRQAYLSPAASQHVLARAIQKDPPAPLHGLSLREMEVLHLIADGETSKTIARRLNISPKTVDSHRTAAMRKIGARTIAHVVQFAIKNRLVTE